jgi:hypothetical protein
MLSLFDRNSVELALSRPLSAELRGLLDDRLRQLAGDHDAIDLTHIVLVEAGDTEADLVEEIGLTPLVNPSDGSRFGEPGFVAWWDWLSLHESGFYELLICVGDTGFAYHLIIDPAANSELVAVCREYAG